MKWLLVVVGSAWLFVGCGGGHANDDVSVPPDTSGEPKAVAFSGPATVEEGSRVVIQLSNLTEQHTLTVDDAYVLTQNLNEIEFVAPTIRGQADKTVTVRAALGEEHLAAYEITIQPLTAPEFDDLPRSYPLESGRISKYDKVPRDSRGVPLFEYNGDRYYYHVQLSKIAQVYYSYIKANGLPSKETNEFLAMAEWLKDNCVYTEWGFCSWRAGFDIPAYRLPSDWTSAMAQGQAITVLLSAYAVTQDESYLEVLSDAVAAFNYPITEKGVVADFDGHRFYEEYGSETDPAHVLNGFLFAMAGLYDVAVLGGSETAAQAFEQGLESLRNTLHYYDLGFTSRYDYSHLNQIASTKGSGDGDLYHEIHISQLAWLYAVTAEKFVLDTLVNFLRYDTGGLKTFGSNLSSRSEKIVRVRVSNTISPETHGPGYLTDSNWTWRRYWSANVTPTEVSLDLNNGSNGTENIVLTGLRLTALRKETLPATLALYDCEGAQRQLLVRDALVGDEPASSFLYDVNGYVSYTAVYPLDNVVMSCDSLTLEMVPNEESGIIALRELNIHLEQPIILQEVISRYETLKDLER